MPSDEDRWAYYRTNPRSDPCSRLLREGLDGFVEGFPPRTAARKPGVVTTGESLRNCCHEVQLPRSRLLARNNHLPRVVIRRAWRIVHSSRSYRFDECKTDWRGQHYQRIRLTRATEIGRTNIGRAGTKRHWTIGQLIENPSSKTSENPGERS